MSKRIAWAAAACLVLLSAVGGVAWHTYAGHEIPPAYAVADESSPHKVFAYGTLRFAPLRRLVVGRSVETETAVLAGYDRVLLDIEVDEDARVHGEVFEVSAGELRRLDRYERVGVRYTRERKLLEDGTEAWVYRRVE